MAKLMRAGLRWPGLMAQSVWEVAWGSEGKLQEEMNKARSQEGVWVTTEEELTAQRRKFTDTMQILCHLI